MRKLEVMARVWLFSVGSMACLIVVLGLVIGFLNESNELIKIGEIISGTIASITFMCMVIQTVIGYVQEKWSQDYTD